MTSQIGRVADNDGLQDTITDFAEVDRPAMLHVGFQELSAFKVAHGRDPRPGNKEDGDAFVSIVEETNKESIKVSSQGSGQPMRVAQYAYCRPTWPKTLCVPKPLWLCCVPSPSSYKRSLHAVLTEPAATLTVTLAVWPRRSESVSQSRCRRC